MIIGCPAEIIKGENRIALTPKSAIELKKLGFNCQIEKSAGANSGFSDKDYQNSGVKIISNSKKLWETSDIIIKVRGPEEKELKLIRPKTTIISFIWPAQNKTLLKNLNKPQFPIKLSSKRLNNQVSQV